MKPIESMTVEELADELAVYRGWTLAERLAWKPTLDSAARAMPEGKWEVSIVIYPGGRTECSAWKSPDPTCCTGTLWGPTELEARLKLALACWRAKEGKA